MSDPFFAMGSILLEIGLLTLPLSGALGIMGVLWGAGKFLSRDEDIRTHEEGKTLLVAAGALLFLSIALFLIFDHLASSRDMESKSVVRTTATLLR